MVIDIKVNGIRIYNMVKVNNTIQMVISFQVSSYMEINQDMVYINLMMDADFKGSIIIIYVMVMEPILLIKNNFIKDNGNMIKLMEKDNIIIKMVISIQENGKMDKKMDMESINLQVDGNMKENGKMGSCMEKEKLNKVMIKLKDIGKMEIKLIELN